jgi:mono/diheme cytochrome c family protein
MRQRQRYASAALALCLVSLVQVAQPSPSTSERNGAQLYENACAACHGSAGRGRPQEEVGLQVALPDFSDCSFATREPDEDWLAIVHAGGSVRGFDDMMPAFGEALTQEQMQAILGHVRTFCADKAWPRGELNLPRAFLTEKAYPEDEAVLTITSAVEGSTSMSSELIWERRFGARSQIELSVPFAIIDSPASGRDAGIGDIALAVKHALHHSLDRGSILSAGTEVIFPTGDDERGLGGGTTVIEPFILFGKILPGAAFVQTQLLAEFPTRGGVEDEIGWRTALGKSWTTGRFGRVWTPMVEIIAARELSGSADTNWDAVPQLQVTLNTRQHVIANVGVRVPLTNSGDRDTQVMVYVLWDWFDGGLLDGG